MWCSSGSVWLSPDPPERPPGPQSGRPISRADLTLSRSRAGVDHGVVEVVTRRVVELPGTGDQPQCRAAGRSIHPGRREALLRVALLALDGEAHAAAVAAANEHRVAALQVPELVEHGRSGLGVDVAGEDGWTG